MFVLYIESMHHYVFVDNKNMKFCQGKQLRPIFCHGGIICQPAKVPGINVHCDMLWQPFVIGPLYEAEPCDGMQPDMP